MATEGKSETLPAANSPTPPKGRKTGFLRRSGSGWFPETTFPNLELAPKICGHFPEQEKCMKDSALSFSAEKHGASNLELISTRKTMPNDLGKCQLQPYQCPPYE